MTVTARELSQSLWFFVGQVDGDGPTRCIPIHSTPFLIGRRPDLALCLPRPTVSTVHAELRFQHGQPILRDLKSTNGTYVNGRRITEAELDDESLVLFADAAFRMQRQTTGFQGRTVCEDVLDRALALVQFDKLMRESAVIPYFQPIVEIEGQQTVGHEVLGRSNLIGLESPHEMFHAAACLNLELELSRMLRWEGIRVTSTVPQLTHVFVNTHPLELEKPGLVESLEAIRRFNSSLTITLEIHEAAVSNLDTMRNLQTQLQELNISLAFDDFGAGQARLVELIEVRPDYLKFDMQLIRGIDQASAPRQQMLASLVKMTSELGILPLAEGVETTGEHQTCREIGFRLAQGYLYGKPAPSHLYQGNPVTPS